MMRTAIFAGMGLAASLAGPASAALFDFTGKSGTSTFAETVGGVTATFSSTNSKFQIENSGGLFSTLSGNVLDNSATATGGSLTITFTKAISAISLNFALFDFFAPSPDTLTTSVGNFTASVGSFYPEGVLRYVGPAITSLTLSSPYSLAVDNISVPEPATIGILGLGLAGLLAARRRRA